MHHPYLTLPLCRRLRLFLLSELGGGNDLHRVDGAPWQRDCVFPLWSDVLPRKESPKQGGRPYPSLDWYGVPVFRFQIAASLTRMKVLFRRLKNLFQIEPDRAETAKRCYITYFSSRFSWRMWYNPLPLQCVFHGIRFKVNKGWAQRSPFFMPFRERLLFMGTSNITKAVLLLLSKERTAFALPYESSIALKSFAKAPPSSELYAIV